MIDAIRVAICGVLAIMCLLASYGVDGTMHNLIAENTRLDLLSQINGARKFLLFASVVLTVICFL